MYVCACLYVNLNAYVCVRHCMCACVCVSMCMCVCACECVCVCVIILLYFRPLHLYTYWPNVGLKTKIK